MEAFKAAMSKGKLLNSIFITPVSINSFFGYDLISSLKVYTFDRTDEKPKNLKKFKSKINLGEIKNKKIENSLKEFAKVYREKND